MRFCKLRTFRLVGCVTFVLFSFFVVLFLSGCGGGGGSSKVGITVTKTLTKITISPPSVTVISGTTEEFTVKGYDQNNVVMPFTPICDITPAELGTITLSGQKVIFTAEKTGTGTITVTGGNNITATASIEVQTGPVNSLVINPTDVTLYTGETQQFTVYGIDKNGNAKERKFITVSPVWSVVGNIGTIDNQGLFAATNSGQGQVKAIAIKDDGTSVSITADVTVKALPQKYTVMVYMVGSDLESGCKDNNGQIVCDPDNRGNAATTDLEEMMQVGSTVNEDGYSLLDVVVETGGANKDGWTTVKRKKVNQGSLTEISDLGNLNMGEPQTLQDFIVWAMTNYPADKYVLILWNHGGGTTGFGWDENHQDVNNNDDNLTLVELKQAFQNAYNSTGKTFEIIGYDACLMATLEVAYNMAQYGKYLVASEEVEPDHGWNYTPTLQAIVNDSSIDGTTLGQVIADGYNEQAQEQKTDKEVTLSVIDLSKIPQVISALDIFSNAAKNNFDTEGETARITVSEGRSKSESYGNNQAEGQFTDMVDLENFAENISASYPTETNALISSITQAVIYKINGIARPNANGVSIFFPYHYLESSDINSTIQSYNSINFSTSYQNMISSYLGLEPDVIGLADDKTAPTFTNETLTGNVFTANVQGNDIDDVYAIITQSDPLTNTITIFGMESVVVGQNGLVSYDWTGEWLTLNDNFVSVFTIDEEDSTSLLDIPAKLNNETVDILIFLNNSTDEYEILGAWPGIDENGMAQKEILPINQGDIISPLFTGYDLNTDEEIQVEGEPFTVGASLILGISSLPVGNYYLGFYATDYAQNNEVSQFASVSASGKVKIANISKKFNTNLAKKIIEKHKFKLKIKQLKNHLKISYAINIGFLKSQLGYKVIP